MLVAFGVFIAASVLELVLPVIPLIYLRRLLAVIVLMLLVGSNTWLVWSMPSALTIGIACISVYRVVNIYRLLTSKMHERHLRTASLQATEWLIVVQTVIGLLWLTAFSLQVLIAAACICYLVVSIVILTYTKRSIRKTAVVSMRQPMLADRALPSITVAIPARNETEDLDACLTTLIRSDYPKLEVLVLDDCSQNKRTPEIIRQFAHAGVRFLSGQVPPDNWLAKNFAYQQLFQEANGELIVFCGVDVRFSPSSLRILVSTMLARHKTMVSVIPQNLFPRDISGALAIIVQPLRYAWELALPRRLFHRPPVLSTCWIVDRELIARAGGFAAVSRKVIPESYFARIASENDGYSFLQANDQLNIVSTKRLPEQLATAVRTRYPQTHRRMELVAIFGMLELGGLAVPILTIMLAASGQLPQSMLWLAIAALSFYCAAFMLIVSLTYRKMVWWSVFLLLPAALADILLMHYSMLRYEFFAVAWKGRNVCLPVMHMESQQVFNAKLADNQT